MKPIISISHINNNPHTSFLRFELKRCFFGMGKLLTGLLLLGLVCIAGVYAFSFIQGSDEPAASSFTVVFVMPENAGIHYTLALGMVSGMDSMSALSTIKKTASEEEAMAMLEDGSASAVVIIPEGMIHSLMDGTNDQPARILYPGQFTAETLIFRQIVDNLAQMVASSQLGIYSLYDLYSRYGATDRQQDTANSQMNELYISTILNRTALFQEESVSSYDDGGLTGYLYSGIALLFLLSGITLCSFFMADSPALSQAMRRLGLYAAFRLAADFLAAVLCQWLIFAVFLLAVGIACIPAGVLSSLSLPGLLEGSLLSAIYSCALQQLLTKVCSSKQACIITNFFASLLLMYCSGCLVPTVFLPDTLRSISGSLPGSQLKALISLSFGGAVSPFSILQLLGEAIVMWAAAAVLTMWPERRLS